MLIERQLVALLSAHPAVDLAFLFGSVGEGSARFESDLDVAVMGERRLTADVKKALIEALARLSGRPVDLIDLQETRGLLLRQILRGGTRLFCNDDTLYALLLNRNAFDQADFAPYRQRLLEERRQRWIGNV